MIEKIYLALGCLTFISLSTIYVVFGLPTFEKTNYIENKRDKKKAIMINGLENAGNDCYLNVIIQSLSASKSFIDWLRESTNQQKLFPPNLLVNQRQKSTIRFIHYLFSIIFRNNLLYNAITNSSFDHYCHSRQQTKFCIEKTLTFHLKRLLLEVNGEGDNLEICSNASEILAILYNFNFESRNEQQDCHELFNILCSSLETEILSTVNTRDSLNEIQKNYIHYDPQNNPKISGDDINKNEIEIMNSDSQNEENFKNLCDSNSLKSIATEDNQLNKLNLKGKKANIFNELTSEYNIIKKSLNLKRNLPTKGLLAHQMCCLKCDHKFTIKFESFNSISLALPNFRPIRLKDCLDQFVSTELLKDVVCENCEKLDKKKGLNGLKEREKKKSVFVKRLTFAKLPNVLVIHFQRLVLTSTGLLNKKQDFIQFPDILIMDEYEHYAIQQKNELNISSKFKLSDSINWKLNFNLEDKQLDKDEQKHKIKNLVDNSIDSNEIFKSNLHNQLNQENHLNHAEKINNVISTTLTASSTAPLSSSNSFSLKNEQSKNFKLSTPLEFSTEQNANFIQNSQKNSLDTNETKAINTYSTRNNEELQSNKMSSNSIELDSNLSTVQIPSSFEKKNAKYKYRLISCILHWGNGFSGHYVNHRRLPNTGQWYFISDTVVTKSSLKDALSSNVYMLFYERILDK